MDLSSSLLRPGTEDPDLWGYTIPEGEGQPFRPKHYAENEQTPFQLHLVGNMADEIVELPRELAKVVKHHVDLPQADYYDVLGQMVSSPGSCLGNWCWAHQVCSLGPILVGPDLAGLCAGRLLRQYGIFYNADWIDNEGELLRISINRELCSCAFYPSSPTVRLPSCLICGISKGTPT